MKNRVIAMFTALCMLLCLGAGFSLPAAAAGDQITVSTAEELIAIAQGDLAGDYIQTADIDLTDKEFTPIGSLYGPFTGTFDGNGYKISGLTVGGENEEYQGLFGFNCGTIRNVTLTEDCTVAGSAYVGGIAGRNSGVIEDCISEATVSHLEMELPETSTYKLLSQNLCQWGDDALAAYSDYVDSTTHSRRPSMLQRILNVDPDLLCFQEVSFSDRTMHGKKISAWDTYLRNNLTDYTIYGTYRSDTDKEGVTVGWKTEKFELLESGMFWLSDNPDAPRSQQRPAWGAGCVRACTWVLLEDQETGEHIALYCTHLDHLAEVPLPREKGAEVVVAKMEDKKAELQERYPDAMFIVTGDFNEESDCAGYKNFDAGLNGLLDDARYAAEGEAISDLTYGNDINSPTDSDGIIDYIFVDSSFVEVNKFQILTDYYNDLRPSDHHGVYAEIEMMQNNGIGGIVGSNGGTVRRVIARAGVDGGTAEAVGQLIGNNAGTAEYLYSDIVENAIGSGKTDGVKALPEEISVQVVATLNRVAGRGAFTLIDGDYAVVGSKIIKTPVCLTVNGVDVAVYPGDVYTAEDLGIEDPTFILNGVIQEGSSIIVPEEGGILTVADRVASVDEAVSGGEYTVRSMSDWMYLFENKALFADPDVVIHLLCDLDFSVAEAEGFTSMVDPAFSFDGHGYTVSNWGTEGAPVDERGFFIATTGAGGMKVIKNLNFENCHIWESEDEMYGSGLVYAVACSNAGLSGLPTEFTMENVHVRDCSMGSDDVEATGFLLSRYGVPGEYVNVYIKNCSVIGSTLDANGLDHKGLLVGKVRSNASLMQAKFFIEDCFVAENEMLNTIGCCGFVLGTIEATGIDAYLSNVGVFNNTMSGTNDGALLCHMNQGGIVVDTTICGGNTLNQTSKYIIAAHSNNPVNVSFTDVYTDAEGFTGVVEGKSISHTPSLTAMTSGEAGHKINSALEDPAFYWAKSGSSYVPAATEAGQVRKVSVRTGTEESITYANGGETITLENEGSLASFTFLQGNGSLEGNQLTVSTDTDTILSRLIPVSDVTEAVAAGDYTVSSLEEWMTLYNNRAYFRNRDMTIHLLCDLDLSQRGAEGFAGFDDPFFSFDGHGNTISNWGSEESPIETKGLFYVTSTLAGGLNYIKNIDLENCHLTDKMINDEYGMNSLVYTALHGNGGMAGLPSALTMENIHIKGCSIITKGEASALLLGRYAPSTGNHRVEIINCTVIDSTLDAGSKDHKGLLVGKPRSNNSGGTAVFNLSDCYLAGNTILNADGLNAGFVFGTAEGNKVTVNLNNIGVVGNTVSRSGDGALVGYADGGIINMKNMLFAANNMTADGSYLLTTDYTYLNCSGENIYTDTAALTAASKYGTLPYTASAAKIARGEVNYILNQLLEEPSFYWGMEDDLPVPADADRTAKLTVADESGTVLETLYLNGGATKTFTYEDKEYELFNTEGGLLEGATLTMPLGGKDAIVLVKEISCEHQYDAENAEAFGETQHKIPCTNDCGKEQIEDCSFGEWTSEVREGAHVHVRSCVCGREEVKNCSYTYTHEEGADTHSGSCTACGDTVSGLACRLRADAAALPAIGTTFSGSLSCTDGCGNTHSEVSLLAGDVNGNAEVSIADVVCILRALSGKIAADEIHSALGNVHKVDGVTANGGLTTADARVILRYLLGE